MKAARMLVAVTVTVSFILKKTPSRKSIAITIDTIRYTSIRKQVLRAHLAHGIRHSSIREYSSLQIDWETKLNGHSVLSDKVIQLGHAYSLRNAPFPKKQIDELWIMNHFVHNDRTCCIVQIVLLNSLKFIVQINCWLRRRKPKKRKETTTNFSYVRLLFNYGFTTIDKKR